MIKPLLHIFAISISAFVLSACERKPTTVVIEDRTPAAVVPESETKTFETARLGNAIDTYEKQPTTENGAYVSEAFAKLDGEIAELVAYVSKHDGENRGKAERKLVDLRTYRAAELARYTKDQAVSPLTTTPHNPDRTGEVIEDAAKRTGQTIEHTAKKIGEGLKDAGDAIGDKVK